MIYYNYRKGEIKMMDLVILMAITTLAFVAELISFWYEVIKK